MSVCYLGSEAESLVSSHRAQNYYHDCRAMIISISLYWQWIWTSVRETCNEVLSIDMIVIEKRRGSSIIIQDDNEQKYKDYKTSVYNTPKIMLMAKNKDDHSRHNNDTDDNIFDNDANIATFDNNLYVAKTTKNIFVLVLLSL